MVIKCMYLRVLFQSSVSMVIFVSIWLCGCTCLPSRGFVRSTSLASSLVVR